MVRANVGEQIYFPYRIIFVQYKRLLPLFK
jgi:hypothetical protein